MDSITDESEIEHGEMQHEMQASDEEVLAYDSDWDGDYYNADEIETEGDALEEEQEARRLQQKQLQSMNEADFGMDWKDEVGPAIEKLDVPIPTTTEDKLKVLQVKYPEFEPLAKDFQELQHEELHGVKSQALSAYLASIVMYFAMMGDNLRDHEIMHTLLRTKNLWETMKDVEFAVTPEPEIVAVPVVEVVQPTRKRKRVRQEKPAKPQKKQYIDVQDLMGETDSDSEGPTAEELAIKAQKRKSLKFYSSQIAQKATKRGVASRIAGGDDDLPQKERKRDYEERLQRDAEKRGQAEPTENERLGDSESEDEYYQTLKTEVKVKERIPEEISHGKRGISYAIEKNKGLTPKRSKDVRNPRVKKRKKYDEKRKKLGSIRAQFSGEKRGGYGGESTGIKSNLVKSVKL